MGRNTKYKMQEVQVPAKQQAPIPGITAPQINYGSSIGGKDAPENNATVGAVIGENLKDSEQEVLFDREVKNIGILVTGEAVDVSSMPLPIFVSKVDNKIYKCDANNNAKLDFAGFAISSAAAADANIKVQFIGVVGGFTGLTAGERYFVQDDGTIGLNPGTFPIQVGIAVSATELFIFFEPAYIIYASNEEVIATGNKGTGDIVGNGPTKVAEFEYNEANGSLRSYLIGEFYGGGGTFTMIVKVNGVDVGGYSYSSIGTFNHSNDISINNGDLISLYLSKGTDTSATCTWHLKYSKTIKPKPCIIKL